MAPTKKGRGLTPVKNGQFTIGAFTKSGDVEFGDEIWSSVGLGPYFAGHGVIFASCLPRLCKTCPRPAAKDVSCWYNNGKQWVKMPGGATVTTAGLATCQHWWANPNASWGSIQSAPVGMTVNYNKMEQFVGFSSYNNLQNRYNTETMAKYRDGLNDSDCRVCDQSGKQDKRTGVGCSNMPCTRQRWQWPYGPEIVPCK